MMHSAAHLVRLPVLHALRRFVNGGAVVHAQIVAEPEYRPARPLGRRRHHHHQRRAAAPTGQVRNATIDRLPIASLRQAWATVVSNGVIMPVMTA